MKKSQYKRPYYEPTRSQLPDYNNFDMKSLECSSVQEASPTNESYEMSWIQKLVNNIDKNDEASKKGWDGIFIKKQQKKVENYEPREGEYKRRSSLPYGNMYSTDTHKHRKGYEELGIKKQYGYGDNFESKYEEYTKKYSQHNKNNEEANESFGQYGKIKRRNKTKQSQPSCLEGPHTGEPEKKKFETYMKNYAQFDSRIESRSRVGSLESNSEPNSIITFNNPNQKSHGSSQLYRSRPSSISKEKDYTPLYHNYTRQAQQDDRLLKSLSNTNIRERRPNEYEKYEKTKEYEYKDGILKSPSMGSSLNTYQSKYGRHVSQVSKFEDPYQKRRSYSTSQNAGKYQSKSKEQEQIKMEDMAKRLNKVLQNINEKSKKLSINQTVPDQNNKQKFFQTNKGGEIGDKNREGLSKYPQVHSQQRNTHSPYEKDRILKDYENQRKLKQVERPVKEFTAYENEGKRAQRQDYSSKYSYDNYLGESLTNNKKVEYLSLNYNKGHEQSKEQNKYQHMKRSLGASKHVPKDIIIEESSSEVTSEISPRSDFLNKEFGNIFNILDAQKSGELTKNNCAVEKIHEQLKYLFGGVLSKIRYKNEKYTLKEFCIECEKISKDFVLSELKQIFSKCDHHHKKTDSLLSFKLNTKEVESLRVGIEKTQTENGNESKRSSNCSEVVKKYEFPQDKDLEFEEEKKNYFKRDMSQPRNASINKVHWAAPQQKEADGIQFPVGKDSYLKKYDSNLLSTLKLGEHKIGSLNKNEKQNIKVRSETLNAREQPRRDFQKLCENLNNKLNKYLTTINSSTTQAPPKTSSSYSPKISLQFSQLHKHWNLRRP